MTLIIVELRAERSEQAKEGWTDNRSGKEEI